MKAKNARPPPPADPTLEYVHHDVTCVGHGCRKAWSQKWPRNIDKTYTEMLESCERSLTGNGWARTWLGGWRCLACRQARKDRHQRMAPFVRAGGLVVGLAIGAYYIMLGVVG